MSPTPPTRPAVVAVSGNPRAGARTTAAATRTAELLAHELTPGAAVTTIELAGLAGEVFAPTRPRIDEALGVLARAGIAVIATPVYKASYTGLLKAFLDLYGTDGLAGVVAVPLVVAGSPAHALAGEVHLRPLLVELGAHVPTRTLTLTERDLGDVDGALGTWLAAGARAALLRTGYAAVQPDEPATAAGLAGTAR